MSKVQSAKVEKPAYGFTKEFEGAVVLALLTRPRFYELAGHAIQAVAMPTAEAAKLVLSAHAVSEQNGNNGCASSLYAIQHLRRLHDDGKLTIEELEECSDYIDWCEELSTYGDVDDLVAAVAPILREVGYHDALQKAIDGYGKARDASEVAYEFEQVASVGRQRKNLGTSLLGTTDDILSTVRTFREGRLKLGIYELDNALRGGLERKALGMVVAPSGAGKSMFLCHITVEALLQGMNVAYVTLELSPEQIKQRMYCNLADMTKEEVSLDPEEVERRLRLWELEGLGYLRLCYQTPGATTPGHVRTWLRDLEREQGFETDVLVVDYADEMVSELGGEGKGDKNSAYMDAKKVYRDLREIMVERNGRVWTASQANAQAIHRARVTQKHTADSQNKNRIVDIAIGQARTAEDEANGQVRWRVNKRRDDEAFQEIGPVDWDAAHGRISIVVGRDRPWV